MRNGSKKDLLIIADNVLDGYTDISKDEYMDRLNLLYSVIVDEINSEYSAYDTECIFSQICKFEKSQISVVESECILYKYLSAGTILCIFSNVAYGLAKATLNGNDYKELSVLMNSLFEGFIASIGNEKLDDMIISESILDFEYASGNDQIMSLRLKYHSDIIDLQEDKNGSF